MNLAFFEQLSMEEAHDYTAQFLDLGRETLPRLVRGAAQRDIDADLSIDSVAPVLEWLISLTRTVPLAPDPSLPEWIRSSESYEQNLFEFAEQSKVVILRGAFYFGESFVRTHSCLRWTVGRQDTAERNQPVVSGFDHDMEMAVLLVTENLFARVIADASATSDIRTAVASWEASIPA